MSRFKKVHRDNFKPGMVIRSEPTIDRNEYVVVSIHLSVTDKFNATDSYLMNKSSNTVIASAIVYGFVEQESIPLGKLPHGAKFEFDRGIYINGMANGTFVKVNDKGFVLLSSGEWQEVKNGQENYKCYLIEESNS